jgi:membrane protease YdiL (CAAX protease family)
LSISFTFTRGATPKSRIERFPYTIPALSIIAFGALTAVFISLASDVNALVAQKANTIGTIFVVGIALSVLTPIVLYRGRFTDAIAPKLQFDYFTTKQALATIIGFFILGIFQYSVNKYALTTSLGTVGPTTLLIFKIDSAIAEELFFSAWLTAMVYSIARLSIGSITSSLVSMLTVALAFVYYHTFVYGSDPTALTFVFGARLIIAAVFLYTHSILAALLIHVTWNILS